MHFYIRIHFQKYSIFLNKHTVSYIIFSVELYTFKTQISSFNHHDNQYGRIFHHPKYSLMLSACSHTSYFNPWHHWYVTILLSFLLLHTNGIIGYVTFWVHNPYKLLPKSIIHSFYWWEVLLWRDLSLFIYSPTEDNLACFQCWVIMNKQLWNIS